MRFRKFIVFLLSLFILSCATKTEEKTLNFNIVSAPATIDPHIFRELISVQVMDSIYEGLIKIENGKYVGGLAKTYEKKGNKYIFTLRDNIYWSDGEKITIDDFIHSFRRAVDPKTAARYAQLLYPIKNAEAINEGKLSIKDLGVYKENNKLVIELQDDVPYFRYILSLPISFPVRDMSEKDLSDYRKTKYSGPYMIKNMTSEKITLVKNPYYYDKDKVDIDKVNFLTVKNFAVVENLIKNKELDFSRVEAYDLKDKKSNGELYNYSNGRVWYLGFNFENPILQSKENRLAISNAIDRNIYVNVIKDDGSVPAKSVISNILGDFRDKYPDSSYLQDGVKSNLLKGKTLRLLASNTSTEIKEANFIQEQLRKNLDVNVEVNIVSFKDRLALTRKGDFDIVLDTYSPKFDDPISILNRWYRPKKENIYWRKKEYDNLISEISNEKNEQKRLDLMAKAEKILVDDAVIAPLYYSTENWYVRKGFSNINVINIENTFKLKDIKKGK